MGHFQSLPKFDRDPISLLLSLPNELLILVASYLNLPRDLYAFLRTNQRLAFLITPLLHKLAVQDRRGRTALQWATYRGHFGLAKLLLSKGFDVNHAPAVRSWPMTPLYYAVKSSRFALVKLLLDHGAHLDATSQHGRTALHGAVKTLIYLEDHEGWEPKLPSDTLVLRRRQIEMPAVLLILLQRGANLEILDTTGYSAFHEAARFGAAKTMMALKMLLDAGAPLESRTPYDRTALHCAAEFGSIKAVELLLRHGADIHARCALGLTPLGLAAYHGYHKVVKVLVRSGADGSLVAKRKLSPKGKISKNVEADVRGWFFWGESSWASIYDLGTD